MRRTERGATAVLVAVLMVPLLGFAAIAVDVGALYAERAQLQNGADAAALAIAADCARGDCGDPALIATGLAEANANDHTAAAAPSVGDHEVTVQVTTENADGSHRLALFFAPVLGIDSAEVAASATATWGTPSEARVIFPLTFSRCAFERLGTDDGSGPTHTLLARDNKSTDPCILNNQTVPGGFGWLDASGDCTDIVIDLGQATSDPGKSIPNGCKAQLDDLEGTTALFPVFEEVGGQGNNGYYEITGFAAFTVTGWSFPGLDNRDPAAVPGCRKNSNCVQGRFVEFVAMDEVLETSDSAEDYGASHVSLID